MTTYSQFRLNSKMRHDFGDQIQVRYRHSDGEDYDTWVSGEEALLRMGSDSAEDKLKDLSRTDWQKLKEVGDRLPQDIRDKLRSELQDRLADGLEGAIGGNMIGDNLADAVRGEHGEADPHANQNIVWSVLLQDETFRTKVLEVAWIQLEGSFPDTGPANGPDDWI